MNNETIADLMDEKNELVKRLQDIRKNIKKQVKYPIEENPGFDITALDEEAREVSRMIVSTKLAIQQANIETIVKVGESAYSIQELILSIGELKDYYKQVSVIVL